MSATVGLPTGGETSLCWIVAGEMRYGREYAGDYG